MRKAHYIIGKDNDSFSFVDLNRFMGPAYIVLSCMEYMRFMQNKVFDVIGRKEYEFLNFHTNGGEAVSFRA
jgi:hypothetical protein